MILAWFQKNLYIVIAMAAMAAVIGVESRMLMSQSAKMGAQKVKLEAIATERDQVELELNMNKAAVAKLQVSLTAALTTIEVGAKVQDQMAAGWKRDYLQVVQETLSIREQRDAIYKEPECKTLAELDVLAACPAIATSMRQRAAQMSTTRGGQSPRP